MPARWLFWSVALGLVSAPALAAGAEPTPAGPTVQDDTEALPPLVPLAHDTLTGHVQLGASGVISSPFGELQNGYEASDLGAGFGALLDAGIGITRSLSIGVWGEGLFYSSSAACRFWHQPTHPSRDPCSSKSVSVGPFVRYHLLQGMRFDPWVLVGTGYRAVTQDTPEGTKSYGGVEWLHVTLGGDYYFLSGVGIGPWLGLDGGVLAKRPNPLYGPAVKTAWHTEFVAGLRVILDIPGK